MNVIIYIVGYQCLQFKQAYNFVGVRCRDVESRPRNHKVLSSSPWSGSQPRDFSMAHTFGASTGVDPRKQNREGLV